MGLLTLQNVAKGYGVNGGRHEILRDINLDVAEGEFVAIVGFSGAGKTTLISLIAGLLEPDSGEVVLNGRRVTGPGPDRGIVFQNYSLLPWLTVFGNIALAVDQVFPAWDAAKRRAHVEKYIAAVNLTSARDKKPPELSGGMRQRVSLARGLAIEPRILLLDEPLSALDALTRATLQDEIARIRDETRKTVILITNDPDEGIYLADRIIPLTAGPGATLGPGLSVDIPRPRDRKALNRDPRFKTIRREVIEFMLNSRRDRHESITRQLILPDIDPEALNHPRPFGGARSRPRRPAEIKKEIVDVE